MLRPATPLTILLFAAFALLLISVISTPIIKAIPLASFEGVNFGVFGFCKGNKCSPIEIGYNTASLFSDSQTATFDLPVGTRTTLSSILILHPIAALFTLIMMILSAAAHLHSPSHSPRYLLGVFILSILTLILTLLSFLIDVLLFVPHMAWGSYLVLAATVLVAASGIVSCAMRRTLVSRKARAKRIAENAEMNGENFYNRQATEAAAPVVPNPPMVNGAPGGDKLPAFAAFDLQKKEASERTSDERIPLTARTPSDRSPDGATGGPPMRQGSNDRYGNPPMRGGMGMNRGGFNGPPSRDEYGNPLPPPGPYGAPGMGSREGSRDRMQNGYGQNGYGSPGGPGYYRGRGGPGGPYRGRGGPGGPGYGRGGFNPQMRGGYGPPGGPGRGPGGMPPVAMMRGGRGPPPGYGAPQYRGPSPGGSYGPDGRRPGGPPSNNTYDSNNQMGPPYGAYNGGEARDSLPRAESPPPLPGDGPGLVGQAVEMDATTGSPSHPPQGFGSQFGNNRIRDSDSDVAGMVSLQQPNAALGRQLSESSKYSSEEPYIPPRQAWGDKGRSSPLSQSNRPPGPTGSNVSHRRQTSGEYFEDVDPRFAEPQPPADLQTLNSSNTLPSSLTPGYTTASSGVLGRDPNSLGHPSESNPHLNSGLHHNNSYEDIQEGSRSPAESERSNFTSVSQRGVNPRWNPQNGPGGYVQPVNRRPVPPPQQNRDILLDTNPDFGLPVGRGGLASGGPTGRSPPGGGMVPRSAYEGGNAM